MLLLPPPTQPLPALTLYLQLHLLGQSRPQVGLGPCSPSTSFVTWKVFHIKDPHFLMGDVLPAFLAEM